MVILIQHWISLASTWQNPRRSLVKADQIVAEHAKLIALAVNRKGSLLIALQLTISAMHTGCSPNSRRQRPNTWLTLLLDLTPWGLN